MTRSVFGIMVHNPKKKKRLRLEAEATVHSVISLYCPQALVNLHAPTHDEISKLLNFQ